MRLYIRNKVKYDPSNAGKPLVFVEIPDPRGFSVGQVKEEFKKKVRAAKVDSLYHRQADGSYEVLADDRTVGFYNIQDDTILETTSNPLWAAAIYYRLREVERDAANQPDDARAGRGLEQSSIQKFMALGILFNGGNNPERQQPPYFEELDQLYEHLQTAGKKPVHMSQKTLDTLQTLKDEYEQTDVHERDSIGQFVERQAVKLGLTSKSNNNGDDQGSKGGGRSTEVQRAQAGGRGRGNSRTGANKDKRPAGQGRGGRRAPQKQRTCEDCEENVATQFCADCQPPLVLCDDCAVVLHRGATRRNHQIKDVSEAPAPARNKGYTPKAYRAPFAMLVAFHRAANEVPSKMSLTADELKPRAQPLTSTDLEIKQGRWFGGFDSLENALMKNELVQKEARTPKYSLMEKGQPLAARCSEFDYAVQNLTQAASVPTIPVTGARPVLRNRQVCLLVDSEEPLRERFVRVARQRGLSARTRKLPVGDFLWVLLPPGVNPDTVRDMPDQELVLSMIVERKTWDDLWSSLKTTRFVNQVQRMKRCGLENLFYLVEGNPKELKGNPGPEVETYLQDNIDSLLLEDQFLVNRTGSWLKTVEWLCHLTNMSIESLQSGGEASLMTYSEFSHSAKSRRKLDETLHASPVTSTVWSATEFTDAIRSHSRGGNEFHDLPISEEEGRSLIVIQGLTLYNKQCHKLRDKALADLLENTHQTAEACVQRHLQGVTDQLIHEDVTQWYILWLQVFKGVIVRRTETEEESAEILCKFYQNTPAVADAPPYYDGDVGVFSGEPEENLERLPEDEVMFASDSQEEDAMIRQALRASEYQDKMPFSGVVSHSPLVKPPSSTITRAPGPSSSDGGAHIHSLSEREQLVLVMKLSAAENAPTTSCKAPVKTPIKPFASQECGANSHTPVMPRTRTEVLKSTTHTAVCNDKTRSGSPDDELEKVFKLSLEEFKSVTHDREINVSDTDNDLEKALELSRMENQHLKEGTVSYEEKQQDKKGDTSFDTDIELERALELSKLESETKNGERHHDDITMELRAAGVEQTRLVKRTLMMTAHEQNGKDASFSGDNDLQHSALDNRDPRKCLASSKDEDFAKALELSRMDCKQLNEGTIGMQREKRPAGGIGLQHLDANKGKDGDSDLEKALELSRIEYTQSNYGVLDKSDECSDPDIIVLEESQSVLPSRDYQINDSYVPSSVPSDHEWDPESENQDHEVFDALSRVAITGNTKDFAILLDSQEPLFEDTVVDDFTYALKVQEDLNKEVNASSSYHHDSPSKRDKTCPELKEQLTDYCKSQKEKYGVSSGQKDKSSCGLDFRRNLAAIACGKPVQVGIASPISRSGNSLEGRELAGVLGDKPSFSSKVYRDKSGLLNSPKKYASCRDEVCVIRDDTTDCKVTGTSSVSSVKNSSSRTFVTQSGASSSPRPFSSSTSTFERVHRRNSSTFSGSCSPSSSPGSSSILPSFSSGTSPADHSRSSSDKPIGPKCGACGEIGHNKNSKMCSHYFSAVAVQRREEQSRKRKAKKEEEEREFNDCVGSLAAQRLSIEDRTRMLGEQLEQLRRQSQNMSDTQKKVEDAIKRKRKR